MKKLIKMAERLTDWFGEENITEIQINVNECYKIGHIMVYMPYSTALLKSARTLLDPNKEVDEIKTDLGHFIDKIYCDINVSIALIKPKNNGYKRSL